MWKGGMKFSRRRIGKIRKITKRQKYKLLFPNGRTYITDPQSLLNQAITFCIGKLRLGYNQSESSDRLNNIISKLRQMGYSYHKIDQMVSKATNRYRFGFETPRFQRTMRGMLKEDKMT